MSAHKSTTPIDRAVADVDRQIAELERQMRETEISAHSNDTRSAPFKTSLKKWLQPPPRRSPTPAHTPKYDLFDLRVNPVKELEASAIPFEQQTDLFSRVPSGEKLAHYLNAGSMKQRAPLKHVQRQNRRHFYIWIALGIVALGLLWLVVH